MSIKNRIAKFLGINTKSADSRRSVLSLSESSSSPLRTTGQADLLRNYKSWVFACISSISGTVSGLDYGLVNDKGNARDKANLSLITPEFLEEVASYYHLSGTAYVWKHTAGNTILKLEILRPDRVQYIRESKYFQYTDYQNTYRIPIDEMIMFKNFSPFRYDEYDAGFGTVQSCAITIDSEYASEVWNWKFFERSSYGTEYLKTDQVLTPTQAQEIAEMRQDQYGGVNNRGNIAVLGRGVEPWNANPGQKEADFIGSQKFTAEKIMAMFKVPKAMLGLAESVNVGNVRQFETIYRRNAILPLTRKIASVLNKHIFNGLFEFRGVVPADYDEIVQLHKDGIITQDEARQELGWDPVGKQEPVKVDEPKKQLYTTAIKSLTKGTEEYLEIRAKKINARQDNYEKTIKAGLIKIANWQQDIILSEFDQKKLKRKDYQLNPTASITYYFQVLRDTFRSIFQTESNLARTEVGSPEKEIGPVEFYKVDSQIRDIANKVDETTNDKLKKVIADGLEQGLNPAQIRDKIQGVFTELKTTRADTIVRTETVRLTTESQVTAWENVDIMKKQRYTAKDERVCPYCNEMHNKVTDITQDFFKKGDSLTVDGKTLKIDYADVKGAPLHPGCRCTLLAIVE